MIVVISIGDDAGIYGPTQFIDLQQMIEITAIVTK
jgi:hypothetical protein